MLFILYILFVSRICFVFLLIQKLVYSLQQEDTTTVHRENMEKTTVIIISIIFITGLQS